MRAPSQRAPVVGPLSMRANVSWTLVGNVVYAACQWAMLAIMARLGTPNMVGQFALALAISTPVLMVADSQLRGLQATDAKGEYSFAVYFWLRLLLVVVAVCSIAILVQMGSYSDNVIVVIMTVSIMKGVDSVANVVYGLFQRYERLDWVAQAMMANGIVSLLALGSVLYVTGDLIYAVVGSALSSLLILLGYVVPKAIRLLAEVQLAAGSSWLSGVSIKDLRSLAILAFPMGLVLMMGSLSTNIPRYFLEHFSTTYELGVYSAIAALLVAGNTVVSALGQSASPRLAKSFAAGNLRSFRRLLARMLAVGALIGLGAIAMAVLLGEEFLELIYGSEYAEYTDVLIVFALTGVVTYVGTFLGVAATSMRQLRIQVPIHAIKIVLSIVLGFSLIPENGVLGAAWVVFFATFASALIYSAVVSTKLRKMGGSPSA